MKTVTIPQMKTILSKDSLIVDDQILFSHICLDDQNIGHLDNTFLFDGFLVLFFFRGELDVACNLNYYKLLPYSINISMPDDSIHIFPKENCNECEFFLLAVTTDWIYRSNLDFSKLLLYGLEIRTHPSILLNEYESGIFFDYQSKFMRLRQQQPVFFKDIVTYLCSAMLCEISSCWYEKVDNSGLTEPENDVYVKEFKHFISLVRKYHTQEHNISFYAAQLAISVQHLSRIVKQITGNTPTYFIEDSIVTDAKNMLRYSNLSMKEIAAKLNYSNQSAFYRMFKRVTGVVPSQYRINQLYREQSL